MIRSIRIKNYALIQDLDLNPSSRLSIITGETGAGKSIMLGALGLLMGKRADTKVLWDPSTKCAVEAHFNIESYALESVFRKHDLDYDADTILRREINTSGKSRAFINDTPVTLEVIREISKRLMDIHSQHESLQLGTNEYQLHVLDSFADHSSLRTTYQSAYEVFIDADQQLASLRRLNQDAARDLDYKTFILNELEEINLDQMDIQGLEKEFNLLDHAEEIKNQLNQADEIIDRIEFSALSHLQELSSLFNSLQRRSDEFQELAERIESQRIELQDIHQEVLRINDRLTADPQRKEELTATLNELYRLQQKHSVDTLEDLVALRNQLREDVRKVGNLDEEIELAEQARGVAWDHLVKEGRTLRSSRKKAAETLSRRVMELIHTVGIENGRVEIVLHPTDPLPTGMDECHIHFSANKGIEPRPLIEVASGGEFSRLIFVLKYLIADKTALPTIIFDEIDTGVSGEIALKMIRMMKNMSTNHQIISISHLPQFAAGGDTHFYVFKDHSSDKSVTRIKELSGDERVQAIAQMIGGDQPSPRAFESARELLTTPA